MPSINLGYLSGIPFKNDVDKTMFTNRETAGIQLAELLQEEGITPDTILATTTGGLPVGTAISENSETPFGLLPVNRIAAPFNKALTIGAVTSDGTTWLNDELIEELEIGEMYIKDGIRVEQERAQEQVEQYDINLPEVDGKTVVITSDGVTTGELVHASARQLYQDGADTVVLATPVIADETRNTLTSVVDKIVSLKTSDELPNVPHHYKEFKQLSDDEIISYLQNTR